MSSNFIAPSKAGAQLYQSFINVRSNIKDKAVRVFFFISIILSPLYIFDSGLPQLAHYLLAIVVILYASTTLKDRRITAEQLIFLFVCWATVRQFVFVVESSQPQFMLPAIFLLFNACAFFVTITFFGKNYLHAKKHIFYLLLASLMIAEYGIISNPGALVVESQKDIIRAIGFFNNPNQLAYYGLCVSGLSVLFYIIKAINLWQFVMLYMMSLFLVAQSLSKAAMLAVVMYLAVFFNKKGSLVFFVAGIIILFLFASAHVDTETINKLAVYQRLSAIGNDKDDTLEGRGLGLLLDPDHRIVYGYGEGITILGTYGKEVHSTLGNIIISYGIIGFVLILLFYISVFIKLYKTYGIASSMALLLPTQIYGLAHNGIRFSIYWVFMAVLVWSIKYKKNL